MRLSELDAVFERIEHRGEDAYYVSEGSTIENADGVCFLCPKCFAANGGRVGTHSVICWRPRVPQEIKPGPGRWEFEGTSIEDLTLRAASSSVLLEGGCNAHFFIENGNIRNA